MGYSQTTMQAVTDWLALQNSPDAMDEQMEEADIELESALIQQGVISESDFIEWIAVSDKQPNSIDLETAELGQFTIPGLQP